MSDPDLARTANLLGTLAIALSDRLSERTEAAMGGRAQMPAAIVQIGSGATGTGAALSIAELNQSLSGCHSATVRMVAQLVDAGLVEKSRRPDGDGREVRLSLTPEGRSAMDRILAERRALLEPLLGRLSAAERLVLSGILERCISPLICNDDEAEQACRLCDLSVCPQDRCPANPSEVTNV